MKILLYLCILSGIAIAQSGVPGCANCKVISSTELNLSTVFLEVAPCEARTLDSNYDQVAGTLTITKRSDCNPQPRNSVWAVYCPKGCDFTIRRVWREVYGVKDGKLALLKTVEGQIIPASKIPESFKWPE
jgi:hypothetical protein